MSETRALIVDHSGTATGGPPIASTPAPTTTVTIA